MSNETNDNDNVNGVPPWAAADAHGHAALLLSESLLHALIEKRLLSPADALDIVDTARDVTIEIGDTLGESWPTKRASLALLAAISHSLKADVP